MIAKVQVVNGRKLVAVCDDRLLGKRFEEGELQLDLTGSFYKGEKVSEEKLGEMLKDAYVTDFVGEESVGFGIRKGMISDDGIIKVAGIPHAQAFSLD